ncbi:hypothetical protein CPB83DRAFT_820210 [Crepidotus variabilis]|uniref:Uncharacterized protein n=1 Tax=Crepidotus variabilis TaxID=179855 RepID=A0A9P6E8H8_9AGAR|nr:hypothetical protein CPB83DRAFT_820210 [Crepidotus variabilis]
MAGLPAEIWTQIFDLAADEDLLFQPGIPTALAESAWFREYWRSQLLVKDSSSDWSLRSPEQAMDILQRRSYATKKSIVATCSQWRELGSESLFRCLYFSHAKRLLSLCSMLDASSKLSTTATQSHGWWTRRIHIGPDIHPISDVSSIETLVNALVTMIRHCPNIEIFMIRRPLGAAFGPVVDALASFASQKLHTIYLNIPGESAAKVIWAFSVLPNIVAAHVAVDTDVPPIQEIPYLGSAGDLQLNLPHLQQVSLRGYIGALLEQFVGWDLPSLRSFTIDSGTSSSDPEDITEFLKEHGLKLMLLDLNLKLFVDVTLVLELCPNLTTFAFNADWRITPHNEHASDLVKRPHEHIATIGLHGLLYAFGVGTRYQMATSSNSFEAQYAAKSNDLNMAALNRRNFPKLQRIRTLSSRMLEDLNNADGPSVANGGYHRWNRWWQASTDAGIRLEDCTGALLGTLPCEEEEESDEESDEEEEEDEVTDLLVANEEDLGNESEGNSAEEDDDNDQGDDSDSWGTESVSDRKSWHSENPPQAPGVLSQLIQEVRAMNETRDEALIARIRIPRPTSPWGS